MTTDTVMTLRITARPFQPLANTGALSKWDSLFAQLTPEAACIEGFEEEDDVRACGQALKKWVDKHGIKGLARSTKSNADGLPCVWLLYEKPPATTWKPEQPATFSGAEPKPRPPAAKPVGRPRKDAA